MVRKAFQMVFFKHYQYIQPFSPPDVTTTTRIICKTARLIELVILISLCFSSTVAKVKPFSKQTNKITLFFA